MDYKFDRGDHVSFVYGSVFSPSSKGAYEAVVNGGKIISRKSSGGSGGPEYRVAGFSGWWPEEYLVLVSSGSKNSLSRDEAVGADTLQGPKTKCDTEDSGKSENKAEWLTINHSIPVYACSSCHALALCDPRGRAIDSKFCPYCGKFMINYTPEDEE